MKHRSRLRILVAILAFVSLAGQPACTGPSKAIPSDEQDLVAAMKGGLRNLETSEIAFYAESGHYTVNVRNLVNVSNLPYSGSSDVPNSAPRITLSRNGWFAVIGNPRTPTMCVIYVGTTPRPPARREHEPACR